MLNQPMIYHFPDFECLRLAITGSIIPLETSLAAADAQCSDDGIWVKPATPLPDRCHAALAKLGVKKKKSGVDLPLHVESWPQLFPVTPAQVKDLSAQTPVLFSLADDKEFPSLVGEMLRLGNDRQSFRFLTNGEEQRFLLRVINPPYYSLLRALDRDGKDIASKAYAEARPRVWVQVGYTHPLADLVQPPVGRMLLLGPPREWQLLPEAPFRDIYEIVEFQLPAGPTQWQGAELGRRLTVPLKLTAGNTTEPAELWVLRHQAIQQIDQLVQEKDDALLGRLSFAVTDQADEPVVVLRVRPSRQPPPVLILDAIGFRSYWKLKNLFVPCGRRLQPPLRRDAVRRLLAENVEQIVWLYPEDEGRFTPQSLPDAAFRPLNDWVDYILDRNHQPLQAWMESAQFAFESFVTVEQLAQQGPKPKPPRRGTKPAPTLPEHEEVLVTDVDLIEEEPQASKPDLEPLPPVEFAQPRKEIEIRLAALERQFLEIDGPLDDPGRQALWPKMAELHAALGKPADLAICYYHSFWDREPNAGLLEHWLKAEDKRYPVAEADVQALIGSSDPNLANLRQLVVSLLAAATAAEPLQPSSALLAKLRQYLEKHEDRLSVRGTWLAWQSFAKLSGGDVLALVRARDRILERLLQHGLGGELDLPSFLRFGGQHALDRFRTVRDRLIGLRDWAQLWIADQRVYHSSDAFPCTPAYTDLMFAFGLARLGETAEAQKLFQGAIDNLQNRDDVHSILLEAYSYRIRNVMESKPHGGSLPTEQLEYMEQLKPEDRYKVDRLRQHSRILDPHEQFNPYRRMGKYNDKVIEEIVKLPDITDRKDLERSTGNLLKLADKEGTQLETRVRILGGVLGVAPRLGESFTIDVLNRARRAVKDLPASVDPWFLEQILAPMLERGLFLAGHFDQGEAVQAFLASFVGLFESRQDLWSTHELNAVIGQGFRGLRKLGLREEISDLLHKIAGVVLQGESLTKARQRLALRWPKALCTLLHVAGGWLYFGKTKEAYAILNEARQVLFQTELMHQDKTKLACAYIAAQAQGEAELALERIEELLQKLERIADTYTTNSHYALSQLDVIEAIVLAVVNDDFALGQDARRWLDEDEYLIRRRIHRDVRSLLVQ